VPPPSGVSAREADVLAALTEHLSNAEIAARLFISVRTVESHVSSLLRKYQVSDRRALGAVAAARRTAAGVPALSTATLPTPLTSFVGRVAERAELADALAEHRLVAAIGPGGVGKTRLAQRVVADIADRFADGAIFVDLVPVTDPAMIASAIAAAFGLTEYQGRTAEDSLVHWLTDRQTLLVLDNCEHLQDGVVEVLEGLLTGCPQLTVLVTSRARLLVPFERVFLVPALSVDPDRQGSGDAVDLFIDRASAAGSRLSDDDRPRVAAICTSLDGMALAIELAAARLPSVGLDGVEAGLADRLHLLTSGRRSDHRHHSLASTLDWSYALLGEIERAVLRRISVFASPFTAEAAATLLAGWIPLPAGAVPGALAGLAEKSLLVTTTEPGRTRYRALETIRQYGTQRLADTGESPEALIRHLTWCLDVGQLLLDELGRHGGNVAEQWRMTFDDIADDLRAALGSARADGGHRPAAYRLAIMLADMCFQRGFPGESQRRYEEAAALAPDPRAVADALDHAAGAAESRHFGNEAMRLHRLAADAALRAGDRAGAASQLARAAELIHRGPGLMATPPNPDEVGELLGRAWELGAGDDAAEARVFTAEAYRGVSMDPVSAELADRAITLARRVGDPLIESAALDQLTAIQLARGEIRAAAASSLRRTKVLAPLPVTALSGFEFTDAYVMATECAIAAGDLVGARMLAKDASNLPFHREEGHLATARLIVVTALAGDWDETVALGDRFLEGWERAGRPRTGNLSRGAYAAATVHGLRGDEAGRTAWLEVVKALETKGRPISAIHFGEFFDAMLLLHRGLPGEAMAVLATPPEHFREWHNGMWRPWYAALWAEAAVMGGAAEAGSRLLRARWATVDNPIADAIIDRAAALAAGDRHGVLAAAVTLKDAGCRYQWARTLDLAGGPEQIRGVAALAEMGATAHGPAV